STTRELVGAPDEVSREREASAGTIEVIPEHLVQTAATLLRGTFSPADDPPPKELTKSLEAALEMGRDEWPTGLCRRLAEVLLEVADERGRSPAHRGRWFNLLGFDLRLLGADALWSAGAAVRPAQFGSAPGDSRPLAPRPGRLPARPRERGPRLGLLPRSDRPPQRSTRPRRGRQPPPGRAGGAAWR